MGRIRKLYFFDKKSTEEMISFLNNSASDTYINRLMFNPFLPLHHLIPLKLKFLPESYLLKDGKETKGLVTVSVNGYRQKRVEIQKLFFEEGAYTDAAELVQFVVAKYKALGAFSIQVKVDDYLPELLTMLVAKCGFSQISYEKLWRVNKFADDNFNKPEYRFFRNSDANVIASLYNDSLLPHFRPFLNKEAMEFKEKLFRGLSYYTEYKYVIEDKKTRNPVGCIIITTYDNENYVLDIIQSNGVELDVNSVLAYATSRIRKRKKSFGLFIRTKRYTQFGEKYESQFIKNGYECVQNQIVLTNSSAKILREATSVGRYTVIGDFCSSGAMPI